MRRTVRLLPQVRVRPRTALYGAFYALVALFATAPAWIVEHPPLQDLPFHFATLRIVHDIHNPAFGFADVYQLNLFHTEYLLYYVVGDVLAFVVGREGRERREWCASISAGCRSAMRALLRALGRDTVFACFVVPLSVNAMFCFGLLPFVFGFPLMLLSLAAAVRHFEKPTRRSGIVLGVLTVLTFFAHVLPFALFGVGLPRALPLDKPAPVDPRGGAARAGAGAGDLVGGRLEGGRRGVPQPRRTCEPFAPVDAALAQFTRWSVNVFRDPSDETWFVLLCLVAVAALGLSAGDRDGARPVARGWFVLPAACMLGYLSLGNMLGDVWMFGQRFAVPALFTTVSPPAHAARRAGAPDHGGGARGGRRIDAQRVQALHPVRARGRRRFRRCDGGDAAAQDTWPGSSTTRRRR